MDSLLRGAFDLHVHCSPDVVPRAQDMFDLARAASESRMAGIGLKDHTTSTVGRCHALNRMYPDGPRFFSSIALNPPVGGLNPSAVEAALSSGVDIVYFPTYSADHHIALFGTKLTPVPHPADGFQRLSILDENQRLLPQARAIVELIAKNDAVLATGHISPRETLVLLEFAKSRGIERMVVTHASQSVPDMAVDDQRACVAHGAMIEHCFLAVTECCPGTIPLESMVDQIRSVGARNVILSSDFGQPSIGPPIEAFGQHAGRLLEMGLSEAELRLMLSDNPRQLVTNRRRERANEAT
ncbi:MAG: DUF6282 family protein [Planctomycetota bacterium]